jgi:hypothetical protein
MKKITVRENNGRCLIRFSLNGTSHTLTLGSYSDSTDRLKAERLALEITESIANREFEDLTPWKPKRVTHSREGILEALYSLLEVDHNASGVIKWLEKYDGEIRGKRA